MSIHLDNLEKSGNFEIPEKNKGKFEFLDKIPNAGKCLTV